MLASRRGFIKSLFIAPAIVAATNIMPVKAMDWLAEDPGLKIPKGHAFTQYGPEGANTTIRFLDTEPYYDEHWIDSKYKTLYKAGESFDAGVFYAPYIPLQMVRAVGANSAVTYTPDRVFKTRYGIIGSKK